MLANCGFAACENAVFPENGVRDCGGMDGTEPDQRGPSVGLITTSLSRALCAFGLRQLGKRRSDLTAQVVGRALDGNLENAVQ